MAVRGQVSVSRRRPLAIPVPRQRAVSLALVGLVLAGGLVAYRSWRERQRVQQNAVAEQQRQRQEAQCRSNQVRLQPLVDALRGSQQEVLAIEAEAYLSSGAPAPLNPDEQRRLAVYDQEIEQEQYDQAYAAWQERDIQRRAVWRRDRQARLAQARERRAAAAAALQAAQPDLLSSSDPPQLNQAAWQRALSCGTRSH